MVSVAPSTIFSRNAEKPLHSPIYSPRRLLCSHFDRVRSVFVFAVRHAAQRSVKQTVDSELHAVLARYASEPKAHRELLRWRKRSLIQAERLEVAEKLAGMGAHRAAALWLITLHRASPDDPFIAYRLGNALRMAKHVRAAECLLAEICRRYPTWTEPVHSLAWLSRRAGRAEAAADILERWCAAVGYTSGSVRAASAFLEEMGMVERAERLLEVGPSTPVILGERGGLLAKLGRFKEAETLLRRAVKEQPWQAGFWLRLAKLRRWESAEASPLTLMKDTLRHSEFGDIVRATIGFGLAKIEDDIGDYEAAWKTLEWANALRARSARFDRAAWRNYERALYSVFTPEFFNALPASDDGREAPVFIVGMPRSGTTLLERRLGRHSALVAAGELEVIETLGIELAGRSGYPAGIACVPPGAFDRASRSWRARLPIGLPRSGTIVDKNPLNFLNIGLIACLFPRASVLHLRRDPLATALSLWFENFAHPKNDFTYRVADIAWMYALYSRIMVHWARVLPRLVHAVDYERVATSPEVEFRALVEWLGLDWEPSVLDDSIADDGAISTASLWQARQPVYTRSVGRARHYEPWIAPLRDALANEGVL